MGGVWVLCGVCIQEKLAKAGERGERRVIRSFFFLLHFASGWFELRPDLMYWLNKVRFDYY